MQQRLEDVPGLKEQATAISAHVERLNIPLVSRTDLTHQMSQFVQDNYSQNCQLTLGEECASVDFTNQVVTTSRGRRIPYDLLLGADGVNSRIRQLLVQECGFVQERYIEDARWKALVLPKQPDLDAGAFKPLKHPAIGGGQVLPKAPEGHLSLIHI